MGADIPRLYELLVVIPLLAPGFFALKVTLWLAVIDTKLTEFEQVISARARRVSR